MKTQLLAAAFAAVAPFAAVAQETCPHQQAQNVEASLTYGPSQECGGFTYKIGDVRISSDEASCPLFVIYVPPHQIAAPSANRTMVDVAGMLPITQSTFRCAQDWVLFIPWGTVCVLDRTVNLGSVTLLVTRPCP